MGSWSYMAPERFSDDETTYRSDIYALACVLYECLTGTPPYRTQNLSTLMGAHLMQPIPRPSQRGHDIPTAFDGVIAQGMAKSPTERYPTAGDLATAAQRALSAPDRDRGGHPHRAQPTVRPATQWPDAAATMDFRAARTTLGAPPRHPGGADRG